MSNHKVPPNHSSVRPKSEERQNPRAPPDWSLARLYRGGKGGLRNAWRSPSSTASRSATPIALLAQLGAPGLGDERGGTRRGPTKLCIPLPMPCKPRSMGHSLVSTDHG